MTIVGIETSLEHGFVFLGTSEHVLSLFPLPPRSCSSVLAPSVERLVEEANSHSLHIDIIGVGLGPGSFTGARIGISFAKALALALGIKVVGVPTLESIAGGFSGDESICPIIFGYRNRFFGRFYKRFLGNITPLSEYLFLSLDGLASKASYYGLDPVVFVPSAGETCAMARTRQDISIHREELNVADSFRRQVFGRIRQGQTTHPSLIAPIYLMPPLIHGQKNG